MLRPDDGAPAVLALLPIARSFRRGLVPIADCCICFRLLVCAFRPVFVPPSWVGGAFGISGGSGGGGAGAGGIGSGIAGIDGIEGALHMIFKLVF